MKIISILDQVVLDPLRFWLYLIRYTLIFGSAFFRSRVSLGCELLAMRSQLAFYQQSLQPKKEPRLRFTSAFLLLRVLLSKLGNGWRAAAHLMQPETVGKWHRSVFRQGWRWKSLCKGGRPYRQTDAGPHPASEP